MVTRASSGKVGFKKHLLVSAALTGLMGISQQAEAQGIIGLEALVGNHARGTVGEVVIPLVNSPVGMFYTSLQGGRYDGENVASWNVGYRAVMGEWLVGGHVGGDIQGFSQKERLWGATIGAEILLGNLGFSANYYHPLSKARTIKGTGYQPNLGLHDQPGNHDCTRPNSTNSRTCVLEIQGKTDSKRTAYQGADAVISYRLPFLGDHVDIVPQVGGYLFENDIKGWQGGVEIVVGLGGGAMLTGGGKVTHDRRGTDKIVSIGLQWNFGGAAGNATYLQRQLSKAPRRLQPGMVHGVEEGEVYGRQQLSLQPGGSPIRVVQFVDASNQSNAASKVANIGNGGMVIFSGNVQAPTGQSIEVKQENVAVVGGNTTLALTGIDDGKAYSFTTPGTRPTITQSEKVNTPVFLVDGRFNTYFQGLDIDGGRNALRVLNSTGTVLQDVKGANAGEDGFYFENSLQVKLTNVTSNGAGNDGLFFAVSDNARLNNVTSTNAGGSGLFFAVSSNARLNNVTSSGAGGDGLLFRGSVNVQLNTVTSSGAGNDGLAFELSDSAELNNVTSNGAGRDGLAFTTSFSAQLNNVTSNNAVRDGLSFSVSNNAELNNVTSNNAGSSGLLFSQSSNSKLDNVTSNRAGRDGLAFTFSNNLQLFNVNSTNAGRDGLNFFAANQALLTDVTSKDATRDGLHFLASNDGRLINIIVDQAFGDGLNFATSDNISLEGILVDQRLRGGSVGINLVNAGNAGAEISFQKVTIKNATTGYQFDVNSAVKDSTGNTASNVTNVCDNNMSDSTGTISVVSGGTTYMCR